MRISDWSSDVCSSDLVDLHTELHVLAGAVALPGAGRLQRDGGDRRVTLDVDLAVDLDDPRPDLLGGPHRIDELEIAVDSVGRGQCPQRPGAEDALNDAHLPVLPISLRSEEHTSELQSLMRISYAVFCLKKKHTLDRSHTYR